MFVRLIHNDNYSIISAGLPITIKGDGVIHDTLRNGHYNVRYAFGVPFQGTVLSVIDTDYKEYAVLHSCTNRYIE